MMPVTPISLVVELFYPQGFAHDYEWTTQALGMRHVAIWNDTYVSRFRVYCDDVRLIGFIVFSVIILIRMYQALSILKDSRALRSLFMHQQ